MRRSSFDRFLPAVFSVGVVLGSSTSLLAQEGPGLSSGSGAGTGSGLSTGVQRNQSGSASGVGPGSSGFDRDAARPFPFRRAPSRFNIPAGPGVDVTFPTDPGLVPFLRLDDSSETAQGPTPTLVSNDILAKARQIQSPSERSMAFQLIARGAIYSNQFSIAHQALEEAANSALQEPTPLTHDLRLMAVITTITNLSDAVLREGKDAIGLIETAPPPAPTPAQGATPDPLAPKKLERKTAIQLVRLEWNRASYLAKMIHNPTDQNEMLYRIIESQIAGSGLIAAEYGDDDTGPSSSLPARPASKDEADAYRKSADDVLLDAVANARQMDWPVWMGRSLIKIVMGAADSQQYARGLDVARSIQDPEFRSEALLFLAESQARLADRLTEDGRRNRLSQDATQSYTDAAQAVTEIRQMGLRGVCTGFLVDSLISVGRFDDARACVSIYPERYQQFVALGAIAESQGKRGSAEAARDWIARDMPESYKASLYRRVTRGVLDAIEQNRSQENLKTDLGR